MNADQRGKSKVIIHFFHLEKQCEHFVPITFSGSATSFIELYIDVFNFPRQSIELMDYLVPSGAKVKTFHTETGKETIASHSTWIQMLLVTPPSMVQSGPS